MWPLPVARLLNKMVPLQGSLPIELLTLKIQNILFFKDFQLDPSLQDGLDAMGFKKATPIQEAAIPAILDNKDLLACAQTGTGKTAAFILPIIHKITTSQSTGVNTLVLAPTRELAQQIDQQIEGLGYFVSVSSKAVFGGGDGVSWEAQKRSLLQGADIVVATPGRLIAILAMGNVDFSNLQHLVLDEADRMLDMGFIDDIMRIISYLPAQRQTLLFSATMPPKIEQLAQKILNDPHKINLAVSKPAAGISQQAYVVYDNQKDKLLLQILEDTNYDSVLVFASTKVKVKQIFEMLRKKKVDVEAFHSDLEQTHREEILLRFKSRNLRVISATDVLARGIDVDNISLVINYDAPGDPEDYVHRVGRTARAARTGVAITFIGEGEQRKFSRVEKLIDISVPKMNLPDDLGPGPDYDPAAEKPIFQRGKSRFHHKGGPRPPQQKRNQERSTAAGEASNGDSKKKRFKPRGNKGRSGAASTSATPS